MNIAGDIARRFLEAHGWQVGLHRARKGTLDIPAPHDYASYDIHDLACVLGLDSTEACKRIVEWNNSRAWP